MPSLSHPLLGSTSSGARSSTISRKRNRVLRERIESRRLHFTDDQRLRLAAKARTVGRRRLGEIATIVTSDTLLAWHRTLIAKQCDGSIRRGPGRPPVVGEIRMLIGRMATENRGWGYTRIQGALANLNHDVSRDTSPPSFANTAWRPRPIG
jgi:hypothetical protein